MHVSNPCNDFHSFLEGNGIRYTVCVDSQIESGQGTVEQGHQAIFAIALVLSRALHGPICLKSLQKALQQGPRLHRGDVDEVGDHAQGLHIVSRQLHLRPSRKHVFKQVQTGANRCLYLFSFGHALLMILLILKHTGRKSTFAAPAGQ